MSDRDDETSEPDHPHEHDPTAAESADMSEVDAQQWDEDEEQFVEGLVVRGEVAPADGGTLPSGATHEAVEEDENGVPTQIRRRRFAAH